MRKALSAILIVAFLFGVGLSRISADPNVDDNRVAIKGYDPVSYHEGVPQKGGKNLTVTHDGAVYHFHDQENRDAFSQDPEKYAPAYGGWCAWAMLEGDKVPIHPERYKVIEGKLYLFYDQFFINTLEKWNRLAEKETEARLVEKADENWEKLNAM